MYILKTQEAFTKFRWFYKSHKCNSIECTSALKLPTCHVPVNAPFCPNAQNVKHSPACFQWNVNYNDNSRQGDIRKAVLLKVMNFPQNGIRNFSYLRLNFWTRENWVSRVGSGAVCFLMFTLMLEMKFFGCLLPHSWNQWHGRKKSFAYNIWNVSPGSRQSLYSFSFFGMLSYITSI